MAREGVSSESDYITGGVAVTGNISTLALWVVKDDSTLDVIFEQVNNASTSDDQRISIILLIAQTPTSTIERK